MTTSPPNPTPPAGDPGTSAKPTFVVMAKAPVPGTVKTRLTRPTPDAAPVALMGDVEAAEVHTAFLVCLLTRLRVHLDSGEASGVLALNNLALLSDTTADSTVSRLSGIVRKIVDDTGFTLEDQGTGNLGERLDFVWQQRAATEDGSTPVVFLGIDSPDLPAGHLRAALDAATPRRTNNKPAPHAAVGPVDDGGYWCLAASHRRPALLRGIDWGTAAVYDQTREAARHDGLPLADLPPWHDVDDPHDLHQLRQRLRSREHQDPALLQLADTLDGILGAF